MAVQFSEIDFAGNLKEFISQSSDVTYSEEIKKSIFDSEGDDLLKVTKSIASPMEIISVEKVDESYIEKNM